MIKSKYITYPNSMSLSEAMSAFGEKHPELFSGQALKRQILTTIDPDIKPRLSTFSVPSEHANDGRSLDLPHITNPTVADFQFRPVKPIYQSRTNV